MSVKDLIWVNVAQGLKNKAKCENELQIQKNNVEIAEAIILTLCDLRDLAIDTNAFTRANIKCYEPFKVKDLTSSKVDKKRREEEKMAKMTPEERSKYELKKLLAGEIIS